MLLSKFVVSMYYYAQVHNLSVCVPACAYIQSYSNSWESICAPAANENDPNSGLNSMVDDHVLITSSHGSEHPEPEGISGTVDGDGKSCSPHQINKEAGLVEDAMEMEVDEFDVPHGETSEHPEPLSTEQPNSIDGLDLWDDKDNQKLFPLNGDQCNSNVRLLWS